MGDTPIVKLIPATKKDPRPVMTGIYARVSSARVEQLRSLSAQVSAMTRYVYWREGWVLRDIYLDVSSAKTGSSRREFNRLLEDCRKHLIDIVVVKSLSRFGRDNVEVIESVRTLVDAGVTIYFMEEDIKVDANYPELELSIRSAINQAENEQRSENIRMGLKYGAKTGSSGLYRKPCYGYRKNDKGELVIDEAQAEVVTRIFDLYLAGKSFSGIIDALAEDKIPSPRGSERWSKRAIETILTNVKYTGNVEIFKTNQSSNRYVLRNSHEQIISLDIFAAVQREIMHRSKRKRQTESVSYTFIEEISSEIPKENTGDGEDQEEHSRPESEEE